MLAINVKDIDFLQMDYPSITTKKENLNEWKTLNGNAHGISNFKIYYPASTDIEPNKDITYDICEKITLNVNELDPASLNGLLTGVTDAGAQSLPDIFRYWRDEELKGNKGTFKEFIDFFNSYADSKQYPSKNSKGDDLMVPLHPGTVNNIRKQLINASNYFDYEDAIILSGKHIISPGKMSVIHIGDKPGKEFGSIMLRQLLHQIVEMKKNKEYKDIPVLIIIDEVHQFYGDSASSLALGELDTICRTGRSNQIGVIFSSQNPQDLPKGISDVVNSKIFFRTDTSIKNNFSLNLNVNEISTLKQGYAAVSIHNLPELKIVKFPLSFCGVKEEVKPNDKE